MPKQSRRKRGAPPSAASSILPMQLLVGDRYTDEAGEWEAVSRPVSFRAPEGAL
jgi:hypothetical protein